LNQELGRPGQLALLATVGRLMAQPILGATFTALGDAAYLGVLDEVNTLIDEFPGGGLSFSLEAVPEPVGAGRGRTWENCGAPARDRGRGPTVSMGFVGVSTGDSSIMRIFPRWAEILGLPTRELTGFDLPLDATAQAYRDVITRIAADDAMPGALITTHKIGVYQAAADLFAELDDFSALCGEISSLSKKDGRLIGHALDPVTAGLAIEEFLPDNHFAATGGELLCLGAGGAGTAIVWYLAHRADAPKRIFCTDVSGKRLTALRFLLRKGGVPTHVDTLQVRGPVDMLMSQLPPGSVVVNATGLGKDKPGSPVTEDACFPQGGVAWEVNYRGSLEFLTTAYNRQAADNLVVADGWRYFIHGWSNVIATVFQVELTPALLTELSDAAEPLR
jgi:shikimate dehydrogenase